MFNEVMQHLKSKINVTLDDLIILVLNIFKS